MGNDLSINTTAERAVIACVLRWPEVIEGSDLLVSDFFHLDHVSIWQAFVDLQTQGDPIDPVTLEKCGIPISTSLKFVDHAGSRELFGHYSLQVRDAAMRRRIAKCSGELIELTKEHDDVGAVIHRGLSDLQDCLAGSLTAFEHIAVPADDWYQDVQTRRENPGTKPSLGIPTGLTRLNEYLVGGPARGHLTVVGGDSSMGKSALLNSVMIGPAAKQGFRCGVCSFEDSARSVIVRHLSGETGIPNRQLQREQISCYDELDMVRSGLTRIVNLPIWIMDTVPGSIDELCGILRRFVADNPIDILGIDYLQFISAGIPGLSDTEQSKYVVTKLGKLARELTNTAVVLLAQYRKLQEHGAMPTDSDLLGAGAIRHFAHAILHIWCPQKAIRSGCKSLLVSKNKQGPTGHLVMGWSPQTVTFSDPDPDLEEKYRNLIGIRRRGNSEKTPPKKIQAEM
jgi:replicative DNA helicase